MTMKLTILNANWKKYKIEMFSFRAHPVCIRENFVNLMSLFVTNLRLLLLLLLLLLNPTQTNVCSKMIFINTVNILPTKKPDNSKGFI